MRLDEDELKQSIAAQTRQMGREDFLSGETTCPFGAKSRAAKHWREGAQEQMLKPFYRDEWATIYCGDCLQILPQLSLNLAKVAVISDPPYGINADFKRVGLRRRTKALEWTGDASREWEEIEGDDRPFDPRPFLDYPIIALFGANHFADKLPPQDPDAPWKWLLWDKRCGSPADDNSDGELIWTNRTGALRIHRQLWRGLVRQGEENISRGAKLHQMQKPISLMRWIIGECRVPADYTILDPYCGSGSTIRAAKDAGYATIGIDSKSQNCETAAGRLTQGVIWSAMAS